MYFHSVVYDLIADIIVAIASGLEEVFVIFSNNEPVERLLNADHNSNWFLSEAEEGLLLRLDPMRETLS